MAAESERGLAGDDRRTPAGDALSALVVHVLRLGALLQSEGDALARPAGQTSARWQVLAVVEDEALTAAEAARRLGLARQSVQRVADLLDAEGLVEYRENPAHQRAMLVSLTGAGRHALRRIQLAQRAWANEIARHFDEVELADADRILARLADVLASRA